MDITSVYLRELGGRLAFFPDANNRTFMFTMDVGVSIKTLYVEGAHCGAGLDTVLSATPSGQGPSTSSSTPNQHRGVQRPIFSNPSKKFNSLNLKILQAKIVQSATGKPEFERVGQMFAQLYESTATVPYILSVVADKWGPGYVLVTNDGLKIEDSDGTRGQS